MILPWDFIRSKMPATLNPWVTPGRTKPLMKRAVHVNRSCLVGQALFARRRVNGGPDPGTQALLVPGFYRGMRGWSTQNRSGARRSRPHDGRGGGGK